jgi:exonuclease SbcD
MKLIHTGDLHIGMINYSKLDPETGLETRLLDFFKTFDRIIDYAISEKVDAFLFAGDAYKTRDPSPTQQRGFGERIKRLAKNGIPVILAVGNHDTPNAEGKANTLDIYSALEIDNVFVSRKPELLNIATKSGNLQVVTAPWLQKGDFKNLGDKLLSLYEKIKPEEPSVLLGHLEVEGSSFGSEKGLSISSEVTIPISLLTNKKLNYVALGHIHKFQELSKNPSVIYAGSPERIDFGEEKDEKGFVLVEISEKQKEISYKFIESGAREFCTIKIDLKADDQNPTETILAEIKNYDIKDKIVRVVIYIPADLSKEIEMDQIKKALTGANHIAGISRNVERVNRQVLEGQDEVERLTPLEALQKYFELKKFTPEKIKSLEKIAEELFKN